jgi:hypothetical protein
MYPKLDKWKIKMMMMMKKAITDLLTKEVDKLNYCAAHSAITLVLLLLNTN